MPIFKNDSFLMILLHPLARLLQVVLVDDVIPSPLTSFSPPFPRAIKEEPKSFPGEAYRPGVAHPGTLRLKSFLFGFFMLRLENFLETIPGISILHSGIQCQ